MTRNEQFLAAYKAYESLLREHGKEYRTVEESADDLTANRMRISRQIRNYLCHVADPGFLVVADAQILWLERMLKDERLAGDVVKDHLWTMRKASCAEGDPVRDVMKKLVSLKKTELVVANDTAVLGIVHLVTLTKLFFKDPETILTRKAYGPWGPVACVRPDQPVKDLNPAGPPVCCTSDGTPAGKRLGIWKTE